MTKAEACLWKYVLKAGQLKGYQFRRQRSILKYITDFMCLELMLIIEVDGESHLESADSDLDRTRYLHANGWLVLRFWNTQVFDELDAVREVIYRTCKERERINPQKDG